MSNRIGRRSLFFIFNCVIFFSSAIIFYVALSGVPAISRHSNSSLFRVSFNSRRVVSRGILTLFVKKAEQVESSLERINPSINTSNPVVQVGFFEGFRSSWIYHHIFEPPVSPRNCECTSGDLAFTAVVTLERNVTRIGRYEILFLPNDVGISRMKDDVWNEIISSAPSHQRRVYATFEGAWKLRHLASSLTSTYRQKAFHWALTHHSRSDFPQPYGYFKPFTVPQASSKNTSLKNWAEGKRGLIAWMSTWSSTSWKRKNFVDNLAKYISVDLYGQQYRKCPRNSKLCEDKIREYKFYLALENSCCGEYITEKFWRTLSWDIVPVVLGATREEYERLAPPNSFIYIDDFSSMAELASYLLLLDKNDNLYNQYFRWKEAGKVYLNYPPIQEEKVSRDTTVPPGFFYSCSAVCRVSQRYLTDKKSPGFLLDGNRLKRQNSTNETHFDPNNNWWCGSCKKCGRHEWIRRFSN